MRHADSLFDQPCLAKAADEMLAVRRAQFPEFVQRERHVTAKACTKPLDRIIHHDVRLIDLPRLPESSNQRVVLLSEIWKRMPQLSRRRD